MNGQVKFALAVLLAIGWAPGIVYAEPGSRELTAPPGWTHAPGVAATTGYEIYFTSVEKGAALTVMIRTMPERKESAQQWAKDEAANLSASGAEIVFPPSELTAGGRTWVVLTTRPRLQGPNGRTGRVFSEQYFTKGAYGGIIDVSVMGPQENFTPTNRQAIKEFLASPKFRGHT
jgi:hypothetical protein